MRARRQRRMRRNDAFIWELQRHRLEKIIAGELRPNCERERGFLLKLRYCGRADYRDFILPPPLFLAEHDLGRRDPPEQA